MADDDRAHLHRPHHRAGEPVLARLEPDRAEEVPALLQWIGQGHDDALALGQQVRQVVRGEIADCYRHQPRTHGHQPDSARHQHHQFGQQYEEPAQQRSLDDDVLIPHEVAEGLGLRDAVPDDRAGRDRDHRQQ